MKSTYKNYKANSALEIRNKVMISLMIFQAVTTKELNRMTVEDVQLEEGLLTVRGSRKSNERKLKIDKLQKKLLQKYLAKVRLELLKGSSTDKLIVNTGKSEQLQHVFKSLLVQLKKQESRLKNYQQIRDSVITSWLDKYDLRIVQYMAGHKYVSSTERYKSGNMEQLKEVVGEFHPLK